MAHVRFLGYARPIPAALFKCLPDFDVKLRAHLPSVAKFCAKSKQHFASDQGQPDGMEHKPITQIVAESLAWYMDTKKITAKRLGEKAGVSPRTIGNFLKPANRTESASGKEPSGKLTELAMIAKALGVTVVDLVSDHNESQRMERLRVEAAIKAYEDFPTTESITMMKISEVDRSGKRVRA